MEKSENTLALGKLSALIDFSNLINSGLDLNFVLNNLLLSCFGKFHTSRGAVYLLSNDGQLSLKAIKGLRKEEFENFIDIDVNFEEDYDFIDFTKSKNISIIEKINSNEGFQGIILLGKRMLNREYESDDIEFLKTLLNIAAISIENSLILERFKIVNRNLDSKVNQLTSLFDLSKEFGGILDEKKVGKLLMFSLIGQLLVSKFAVVIDGKDDVKILESKFNSQILSKALSGIDILKLTHPIEIENKNEYLALNRIGIKLIVPMQIQGKTKGIILLGKRNTNQEFTQSDIEFVYSVGSIAIISIENSFLFKEALEKQKIEKDLEIARSIQKNLFPNKIPNTTNFEIATYNKTARQVGGDYYDIVKLDDNRILVAIADVSGKGVQAALLMANLQAFLKSICKQNIPLDQASNLINDLVSENTAGGSFITFFWGILDDRSKEFTYVNAGHNPPLLVSNGEISKLKTGGMILGVMETIVPYKSESIKLSSGDALITFTDGITEAMDMDSNEYTDERLETLAKNICEDEASSMMNKLIADVESHTKKAEQSDDITAMVIKVK